MKDLEIYLKDKNEEITVLKSNIQNDLHELLNKYFELNLLLVSYKTQTKSHFTRKMIEIFNMRSVTNYLKKIKAITKRNKIDRVTLEAMEIINKPDRKNGKRKLNEKPSVLEIAELVGKIRSINEKGISDTSKGMVKSLIQQLQNDII